MDGSFPPTPRGQADPAVDQAPAEAGVKGVDELIARMPATLRRTQPKEDAPVIITETFHHRRGRQRVTRTDNEVRLTPTEFHLLEVLARQPGPT